MQRARQITPFFFTYILQMGGQLAQIDRPLFHQRSHLIPFPLQRGVLALAGVEQDPGLPQIHVKSQQTSQGQQGNANPRQLEGLLNLVFALGHPAGAAEAELDHLRTDDVHVLLAHIGRHHKLPGILLIRCTHAHRQVQFAEFARNLARHDVIFDELVRIRLEQLVQGIQGMVDFPGGGGVGLQITRLAREQVAALPGLCIHQMCQQFIQRTEGLGRFLNMRRGRCRFVKIRIIDEEHERSGQHGQRHADGHFGECKFFHE